VLVSFSFPGGFASFGIRRSGPGPGRWCGCEATPTLTGGVGARGAAMSETVRVRTARDERGRCWEEPVT
jgi:hypothetical protein